jgi:glycosyltransferase involved in cell wall biosynthesis
MTSTLEYPRISIVTVVFNGAATIEDTIKSVISQRYSELEYVIIDGGSTDGTVEIIKRYEAEISAWVSTPDHGIYDAMNKALDMVSGDFVLFLGCDDLLWGPDVLSMAASKMADRQHIYYGNVIMKKKGNTYDGYFNKSKMTRKNICHQAIFYPRCLYRTNRYSLKYCLLSDYEYNLRLFDRFFYLDMVISIFDDSGLSNQRNDIEFMKDFRRLVVRHLGLLTYTSMVMYSITRRIRAIYSSAGRLFIGKGS